MVSAVLLGLGCGQAPAPAPVVPVAAAVAPVSRATRPVPVAVPPPRDDGRLPSDVRPTGYTLDLRIDPNRATFTGRASIAVTVEQPTRVIVMHGRALTVQAATVTAAAGRQPAQATLRMAAHSLGEPEELVLTLDQPVAPGPASIEIDYEAPFSDGLHGVYRLREGGAPYAFTQFEPIDARRAFPCFDEPGYKTPFTVTITVPRGLEAFANSRVGQRRDSSDEAQTTFTFETSPPLPTYLVAFAVGAFDVLSGPKPSPTDVRLIAVKGKARLGQLSVDAAAAHLALLGQYFDRPYPYPKLDLVAVPNFGAGAMENPGFVTFREELLLLDPTHASINGRRAMASVMAHELAHQWFGDLVTMAWWDDVWLNEAFAQWMSDKIVDQWRPATRSRLHAIGNKAQVMAEDALASARKIRNPVRSSSEAEEAFDGITYGKGRAVLNMVEGWLGEDKFRAGLRQYIKTHAWGNATAPDLYAALSQASGVGDVVGVMDSFTGQTGVPLVSASLRCPAGGKGARAPAVIHLRQQEYQTLDRKGPSEKLWHIPLCATYPVAGRMERQCLLLDASEAEMSLPGAGCPAFFYPNAGEAGYYRVRLPAADARKLVVGKLSEPERFGIVNNAWAAVWSGELAAAEFLELLRGFKDEPSKLVWAQIAEALAGLDRAVITDISRPAFALFVRDLLGPLGHRMGFTAKPGESDDQKMLREVVLGALGGLGNDDWALREARRIVDAWLGKPQDTDPDVARIALPLAARHGDAALYDRLLAVARNPSTPEMRVLAVTGLGAFEDPALIARTLALVVSGGIKTQDLRYAFFPMVTRRATQDTAYAWIEGHYDALATAVPGFLRSRFMGIAGAMCEKDQVQAVAAFLRPRIENLEGADKSIRQSIEQGLRCAALREKESLSTTQWLAWRR